MKGLSHGKPSLARAVLADACLVRLAKTHPQTVVFTLDHDFQIYRLERGVPVPFLMP